MDFPTFDGSLHIEDFLDWIRTIQQFFDYMEIPEEKQVKIVADKLRGGAYVWWDQIQFSRRRKRKQVMRTWNK